MVKIGKKDIVFSTSFVMCPGETAFVPLDDPKAINLRISVVEKEIRPDDPMMGVEELLSESEYSVVMPFKREGAGCIVAPNIGTTPDGKRSVRIIQVGAAIGALVQVDILFERY